MEITKHVFIYAGIITLFLFVSIFSFNLFLNTQREAVVVDRMEDILDEYQEIQTLYLMSNSFDKDKACVSLESTLQHLDKSLWDTGIKIDQYRLVTEEFIKDPFYLKQKKKFNRNQVLYLSMLKEMEGWCSFNQTIILYFYKKKEDCPDCDSQAFVLTDLNQDLDAEIAIFSFDTDLDLATVDTLQRLYNVSEYPCIVVEEEKYCGLSDKDEMIDILCDHDDLSVC